MSKPTRFQAAAKEVGCLQRRVSRFEVVATGSIQAASKKPQKAAKPQQDADLNRWLEFGKPLLVWTVI